jgi:hypothetical protein
MSEDRFDPHWKERIRDTAEQRQLIHNQITTAHGELTEQIKEQIERLIEGTKEQRTEIAVAQTVMMEKYLRSIRWWLRGIFVLLLLILMAQARHV